jgi:arsenate reductase
MNEIGIDISGATTTKLTDAVARQAQILITMGCGDQCPLVPGAQRDDWPLDDPKNQPIEKVRAIRNEIERRVKGLIKTHGFSE